MYDQSFDGRIDTYNSRSCDRANDGDPALSYLLSKMGEFEDLWFMEGGKKRRSLTDVSSQICPHVDAEILRRMPLGDAWTTISHTKVEVGMSFEGEVWYISQHTLKLYSLNLRIMITDGGVCSARFFLN